MTGRTEFWTQWGSKENEKDFNLKDYRQVPTYNNDGITLHTFIYEDEDGKRIQACFEAFKSYSVEVPVMAIKMRSTARCDSNEPITLPVGLEEMLYGLALARFAESDKELLDEVPAW